MNNREIGLYGENIAKEYLNNNGFNVVEMNYRTKLGEIDIIAKDKENIVFVEVKSRKNLNYGYPAEAVNAKKQNKITSVANFYLLTNNLYKKKVRFDVIEVYLKDNSINHIENAF